MEDLLVHFLLVEDNDDHAELVRQTFSEYKIKNTISRVVDGEAALQYLRREGEYSTKQRPNVVLLDLNLPGISGLDVLRTIKQDEDLKSVPVVILTTSGAETDKARAYEYRANSYLVKPLNFEQFQRLVIDLNIYWGIWNKRVG